MLRLRLRLPSSGPTGQGFHLRQRGGDLTRVPGRRGSHQRPCGAKTRSTESGFDEGTFAGPLGGIPSSPGDRPGLKPAWSCGYLAGSCSSHPSMLWRGCWWPSSCSRPTAWFWQLSAADCPSGACCSHLPTSCAGTGNWSAGAGPELDDPHGELWELLDRRGQGRHQGGRGWGRRRVGVSVGVAVGLGPGVGLSLGAGLCDTRGVGTASGDITRPILRAPGLAAGPTGAGVCAEV